LHKFAIVASLAGLFLFPCIALPQSLAGISSNAAIYPAASVPVPSDSGPNLGARAPRATPQQQNPQKSAGKTEDSKDDSSGKQSDRMFWVVPNFGAVSANEQFKPLSTHEKYSLAMSDSVVDYSAYTWTAILAGQAMGLNSDPELGRGAAGYGRYFWRTFTDGVSGTFFTEAIVPQITHEDPRYFTLGEGGFFHRLNYAISRTFITRTDSGGNAFNVSEVVGNLLESGLSNAYYPPEERGFNQTMVNFGTQMESAVLNHIAQEFWPDIRRKVLRRK